MEKQNNKYKDTVFRNLFGTDEKAEEKFIQLYNALHDRDLNEAHTIKSLNIEQVLYMNFANDIARLVDDKIIILAEHQSTINNNMPLRCLQYIARIYEQLEDSKNKYHKNLVKIPSPEFYVFYNGLEDYPVNKELRLSDAFLIQNEKLQLELTVNVININTKKGNKLLKKCPILSEYSLFVDTVRKELEKHKEKGYTIAIRECMKSNILREYLNRKSKEVNNMLIGEYDYDTDIEVQREESYNQGFEDGEKKGEDKGITKGITKGAHKQAVETAKILKSLGDPLDKIAKATKLGLEEIQNL